MEMLYFRWLIIYVHEVPEYEPRNGDKITKSQFQFVCNHSKHQDSSSCEHLVQLPVQHEGSVITDLLMSFLLPLGKNPWC
jgi:hypothetical protein